MSDWRPEHANQLLTAYLVLRGPDRGLEPATLLHRHWYAVRSPIAGRAPSGAAPVTASARAAHTGSHEWTGEVPVVATGPAGLVVVETPEGRRAVAPGDYVTTQGQPGFVPRVGDALRVVRRLDSAVSQGPWRSWGSGWERLPAGPHQCLHLGVEPARVPAVVHALTDHLGDGEWLVEVPAGSLESGGSTTLTLRLGAGYGDGHSGDEQRESVVRTLDGQTVGAAPPLTGILATGIGWAEEDGSGTTFGEARSEMVARAFARLEGEPTDAESWLNLVADEFRSRGVDPAQPFRLARPIAGVHDAPRGN